MRKLFGVYTWRINAGLRRAMGALANALTGNSLSRIERTLDETRKLAEENRILLRSIHDALKDQTLTAHLLARLAPNGSAGDDSR